MSNWLTNTIALLAIAGLPTALVGCDSSHMRATQRSDAGAGRDAPATCSIERIEAELFVPTCGQAGCHASEDPVAGLDLSSPGAAARLIDQPSECATGLLVVPGDADVSLLYEKLASDTPGCGARMPLLSEPASPELVECVRSWIDSLPAD